MNLDEGLIIFLKVLGVVGIILIILGLLLPNYDKSEYPNHIEEAEELLNNHCGDLCTENECLQPFINCGQDHECRLEAMRLYNECLELNTMIEVQ